jgi:DNA-directed RNA polymerase specialized sigma24 family protein
MRALAWRVAKHHAIDALRVAGTEARIIVGPCNPDEHGVVERGGVRRDPVDTRRQLEILAGLFREGTMPEHGVDILEGIASGCSYREVAADLGLTEGAVEGRLRTMRRVFRARMSELGLLAGAFPRSILRLAGAVAILRQVA